MNRGALRATGAGGACACPKDLTESCARVLEKTGGTPFFSAYRRCAGADAWYAPAGEMALCAARRWKKLLALRAAPPEAPRPVLPAPPLAAALQAVAPRRVPARAALCARFETPEQLAACTEEQLAALARILLPVQHRACVPAPLRAKAWLELPRAEFTGEGALEKTAASLAGEGFAGCVAQNLAHLALQGAGPLMGGLWPECDERGCGARIPRHGLRECHRQPRAGCAGVRGLAAQAPTAVLAYGHMPLMLTRACPLHNVHGCKGCPKKGKLTDRRGGGISRALYRAAGHAHGV